MRNLKQFVFVFITSFSLLTPSYSLNLEVLDGTGEMNGDYQAWGSWPLTEPLRLIHPNIDNDFESLCQGNICSGKLSWASAETNLDMQSGYIQVRGRINNRHEICVDFIGCNDVYNYSFNIDVYAIFKNCRVTSVYARSSNAAYNVPVIFGSLVIGSLTPYATLLNKTKVCEL